MRTRGLAAGSCALALCVALSSCATWKSLDERAGWTLYARRPVSVEEQRSYSSAIEPAVRAVAETFGPFQRHMSIYVWDGESPANGTGHIQEVTSGAVQEVPGIGPARVRAFHARNTGLFGDTSGIYLGAPEAGTVAHELVHVRLAEETAKLPLWLEEGLACWMGDGYLDGERWVVDGLACWPLRELTEARLEDRELERLLALEADDQADVRQNVLAHFIGWAIVFDLARQEGSFDWRGWIARYQAHIDLEEARQRVQRTLEPATLEDWLKRLADPRREVRITTAKGLWKLRSLTAVEALLGQLEKESDPLVKVVLSINVLAAAGEMRLPEDLQGRMWREVWPKLRRAKLDDEREQRALEQLVSSFRWGSRQGSHEPLEELRAYWAE